MHKDILHIIIAAIGGMLFIIIGITRQRERERSVRSGKKPEGVTVRNILFITGICLLTFAIGVIVYQSNHK